MDRSLIIPYLNAFRKAMSVYLREGVGIKSIVFPFDTGAVVVFELGDNVKSSDEFRNDSKGFVDALRRTNLFTVDDNTATPTNTFIAPIGNHIILVKNDELETWVINQAESDVRQLISKIQKHG